MVIRREVVSTSNRDHARHADDVCKIKNRSIHPIFFRRMDRRRMDDESRRFSAGHPIRTGRREQSRKNSADADCD